MAGAASLPSSLAGVHDFLGQATQSHCHVIRCTANASFLLVCESAYDVT